MAEIKEIKPAAAGVHGKKGTDDYKQQYPNIRKLIEN